MNCLIIFDVDCLRMTVKLIEECKVYVTKCLDGSGHDPDLYLLNICELFNCSKNLFAYLMCSTLTLFSVKSSEIIL